jgi:hypothetical protein
MNIAVEAKGDAHVIKRLQQYPKVFCHPSHYGLLGSHC